MKTSPREERAAKVLPHEAILTMLGLAETCERLESARRPKEEGRTHLGRSIRLHLAREPRERKGDPQVPLVIENEDVLALE